MNSEDYDIKANILMLRGLPRSGKSRIAKNYPDWVVVSKDAIRMAVNKGYKHKGGHYIGNREDIIKEATDNMLVSLIFAGNLYIILDECHVNFNESLSELDELLEKYNIKYYLNVIKLDTTKEECIKRAKTSNQEYLIPTIKLMDRNWRD